MQEIAAESLPYRSHALNVGGHVVRYLDEGPRESNEGTAASCPTLLCVHGNPTWSFYWRRIVDRFSASWRVVAVDHLGCGRSDKPPRGGFPYTLAAHRDNLVELIDTAKLDRITLIAHDWGGAIGLAAMLRRRERLQRLVLLNTGAFPPPYLPWRIAACRWPGIGTVAVRGLNLFARAAVRMAMARNRMSPAVAQSLLAPYDSWANRVAIDAFVRDIPMSPRHPTHAVLRELEQALPSLASFPALLVWGMQDWCFRPECLRRFQRVWPEARTVELADAGHYVMEDAPEEAMAALERFLGETARCGDEGAEQQVGP